MAAAAGRDRQPLEYDNAEFWFADGRMVLRGGNGAGKTKVLELTTLMLMRGEVAPSILDPFGSQHRSMKYNLLPSGEADDPREPADSGLGYAWVEFGRRETDATCHYFVCGLGASAKRGTGTTSVNPWQFVTGLRPGTQLRPVVGGYPIEEKELKKLPGVWVCNNAAQYRERLAKELFGLDRESYDNLTELLKHLRKPKLGERLNPTTPRRDPARQPATTGRTRGHPTGRRLGPSRAAASRGRTDGGVGRRGGGLRLHGLAALGSRNRTASGRRAGRGDHGARQDDPQ